jgi:phage terminase small subunit
MSQADAYRAAYTAGKMKPATVQNNAHTLMKNSEVSARVQALRAPVVERVQYGLEQAMLEAEEAMKVAKIKENGGAMVAAVQLRAKLNGLLVDRKEVRTGPLESMPDDALDKVIAQKAKEAGVQLH